MLAAAEHAPRPRWSSKLTALGFGTALALAVIEIGLRLMPHAVSPYLLVLFEPGLRARIADGSLALRSDTVRLPRDDQGPPLYVAKPATRIVSFETRRVASQPKTDEIGFCNPPGLYDGREAIDVIAIGDSFTWCYNVKAAQVWVRLLADRVRATTYDLGQGGNGLYEDVQLLKRFGLQKRPRVVVLNVYEGNDLGDAVRYWEYRREFERTGREPGEEPESLLPAVRNGPLGRHSYAANLLLAFGTRLWKHSVTDREEETVNATYSIDLPGGAVPFNRNERSREAVVYDRRLVHGEISLEIWDEAFREFTRLARRNGFVPVVTYTPAASTTYGERVHFADPELASLLGQVSSAQRAYLAEHAERLGYLFHDLTADLSHAVGSEGRGALLYDPLNIHFTPAGHQVVADSLARFLIERGLTAAP